MFGASRTTINIVALIKISCATPYGRESAPGSAGDECGMIYVAPFVVCFGSGRARVISSVGKVPFLTMALFLMISYITESGFNYIDVAFPLARGILENRKFQSEPLLFGSLMMTSLLSRAQ